MMTFRLVASIPIKKPGEVGLVLNEAFADLLELRVDYMKDPTELDYGFLRNRNVIVTLRDFKEGGYVRHDDAVKERLLRKLKDMGVMYDVEMSFISRYNVDYEGEIVSLHIIDGSKVDKPSIEEKVRFYSSRAYVVKVASVPFPGYRGFLASLLEASENVAVMPIGTNALERIAYAFLGSKLLYCYAKEQTAPGQPRCKDVLWIRKMIASVNSPVNT